MAAFSTVKFGTFGTTLKEEEFHEITDMIKNDKILNIFPFHILLYLRIGRKYRGLVPSEVLVKIYNAYKDNENAKIYQGINELTGKQWNGSTIHTEAIKLVQEENQYDNPRTGGTRRYHSSRYNRNKKSRRFRRSRKMRQSRKNV